jgi:hypothetical protein
LARTAKAPRPPRISHEQERIGVTMRVIEAPVVMRPVTSMKVEKTRSSLCESSLFTVSWVSFPVNG